MVDVRSFAVEKLSEHQDLPAARCLRLACDHKVAELAESAFASLAYLPVLAAGQIALLGAPLTLKVVACQEARIQHRTRLLLDTVTHNVLPPKLEFCAQDGQALLVDCRHGWAYLWRKTLLEMLGEDEFISANLLDALDRVRKHEPSGSVCSVCDSCFAAYRDTVEKNGTHLQEGVIVRNHIQSLIGTFDSATGVRPRSSSF